MAEPPREADASGALDWEVHMVDGTTVRAHRYAAGLEASTRRALAAEVLEASCTCGAIGGQVNGISLDCG
jgi:hypothetical protein